MARSPTPRHRAGASRRHDLEPRPRRDARRARRGGPPSRVATPAPGRSRPALIIVLLLVFTVLAYHVHLYRDFLTDDALISLRYARRLLEGHGLTWSEGPRVEGYSNLLWILLVALPGALGIDLIAAARGAGLALTGLGLMVAIMTGWRGAGMTAGLAAGLAIAFSGPVAVWARGGLEGPLMLALVGAAIAAGMRIVEPAVLVETDSAAGDGSAGHHRPAPGAMLWVSVSLALIALTRPDGALFTVALALALLVARGPAVATWGSITRLAALPVLAVVAQEGFRLAYYHDWVPNPARIKIAFTLSRLTNGLHYLGLALPYAWPLGVLAAVGTTVALIDPATRARVWIAFVPLVAWVGYVIAIGGDFFPGYRLLVPALPPLAILMALGVEASTHYPRARSVGTVALPVLLLAFGWLQLRDPENTRANREGWIWDSRAVGLMLKRAFGDARPLLAVANAGALPYWTDFPALDMLGLNDAETPRYPSPEFGKGWAGHELGDAGYVLGRRPDIVQFSGIRRSERIGYFRVERELAKSPEFQSRYVLVIFMAREPREARQALWIDRESPRLGIVRSPGHVRIPGYLFADNPRVVTIDREGRLGVEVEPGKQALLLGFPLPAGHWNVSLESSDSAVVGVRHAGETGDFVAAQPNGFETLGPEAPVDLLIDGFPGSASHVRAVVLAKMDSR